MRLGHLFNVLAQHSSSLVRIVRRLGIRGMLQLVRSTMEGPWLEEVEQLPAQLAKPAQLRLE